MARAPLFALVAAKMERARAELGRLDVFLAVPERAEQRDTWARTAMIAYVVHGVHNGLEDVMTDELKAFRHFVRHQYSVDLVPEKVEAKLGLLATVLPAFDHALARLEAMLA